MSVVRTDEVAEALRVLTAAGVVFCDVPWKGAKSVASAAALLDLKEGWVRTHLHEFPHAYRLPAGSANGRSVGELRIPVRDLEEFERRRQKARVAA